VPIADHGLGPRLHRVEVPALVVWGHVLQAGQPERTWIAISAFLGE
jgi:hypothetical protein